MPWFDMPYCALPYFYLPCATIPLVIMPYLPYCTLSYHFMCYLTMFYHWLRSFVGSAGHDVRAELGIDVSEAPTSGNPSAAKGNPSRLQLNL